LCQIGKFGKAVQQQHARPASRFEPGFQDMHRMPLIPSTKRNRIAEGPGILAPKL
jgi:hypothetical protein